ncbi:MAG: hypothetical protein JXN61_04615 [Sedimentisphaerales bacterium]|nr:hypothetical protein [Sedimentisphaerales bacterium]
MDKKKRATINSVFLIIAVCIFASGCSSDNQYSSGDKPAGESARAAEGGKPAVQNEDPVGPESARQDDDWSDTPTYEEWSQQQRAEGKQPNIATWLSYTQQHWIGNRLLKQFENEGLADRFVLQVDAELLSKTRLTAVNGAAAWIHPGHSYSRTVDIKESPSQGRYDIAAMVATISPSGEPSGYVLPFGPGCVYALYGKIEFLGCKFSSPLEHPLVFLVYKDNQFVHVRGEGTIVGNDGNENKLMAK